MKPKKSNHVHFIYMFKNDLALNTLQRLICQKNKPNEMTQVERIYLVCGYGKNLVIVELFIDEGSERSWIEHILPVFLFERIKVALSCEICSQYP